jgi:hypothetical protein
MNNQLDIHDPLDEAVRSVLGDIVAATPASSDQPRAMVPLSRRETSTRPFTLVTMAAAAAAIVGVGSVMVATSGGDEVSPASAPRNNPAAPAAAPGPTGPLLSTPLAVDAVPYIVAGDGWDLTDVYANVGPLLTGGFEGAIIFVGDGPLYDAPAFAATVVDSTQTGTSMPPLLDVGEPIDVAGVTGSVYIDRAGTTDPSLTMYWPIDDIRYVLFSATGLTVDEAVTFANQLTLDGDRLVGDAPDGYRPLPTLPTTGSRRSINYRFSDGTREIDMNGENRGIAHLLSAGVIADQTTTRTIDGIEVAVRVEDDGTTVSRIYWMSGDWSFVLIADGFTDEDELLDIVGSLTLTDPETFAAAGPSIDIVMPGVHTDLATAVLGNLGLTDSTLSDAATTDMPMSTYHYGFELVWGATCILNTRWTDLASTDTAAADQVAEQAQSTLDAAIEAGHDRAAEIVLTPLIDIVNGRLPETELADPADCPTWASTS